MENLKVYLKPGNGKLFEQPIYPDRNAGLLCFLCNFQVIDKVESSIHIVVFNRKSGDFAIGDQLGQIYFISLERNYYKLIRNYFKIPILLEFKNNFGTNDNSTSIVVAYQDGEIVVIDVNTLEIMQNIQLKINSPLLMVSNHPVEPKLLITTVGGSVHMWDLRASASIQTLETEEEIISAKFSQECDGEFIVVALKSIGCIIYSSRTFQLLLKIDNSRRENIVWNHFQSYRLRTTTQNKSIDDLFILMIDEQHRIYRWKINIFNYFQILQSKDHKNPIVQAPLSHELIDISEIPHEFHDLKSICSLGDLYNPSRFAHLSNHGHIGLLDIIDPDTSSPTTPSSFCFTGKILIESNRKSLEPRIACDNEFLVHVGGDGIARLYDTRVVVTSDHWKKNREHFKIFSPFENYGRQSHPHDKTATTTTTTSRKEEVSSSIQIHDKRAGKDSKATELKTNTTQKQSKLLNKSTITKTQLRTMTTHSQTATKQSSHPSRIMINGKLSNLKENEMSKYSIFEIANLSEQDKRVNQMKLKTYLRTNGKYPEKYRGLIWRLLLMLPENMEALQELAQRGIHEEFQNISEKYPLKNTKLLTMLQTICSHLAYWSPILCEASYLPSLIFPFMLVYNDNELAIFETVLTIMMWWGYSWHNTHPNPPVHITDAIASLIHLHEPKLHNHLTKIKASIGIIGWIMISTMFSEVLNRDKWFILMDYLISNFDKIQLILLTPVAILMEFKSILFTFDNQDQLISYCRQQQAVSIENMIQSIERMLKNTESKYFTALATEYHQSADSSNDTEEGPYTALEQGRENLSLSKGKPMFPLPKGRYPLYDGYPKEIIDYQIQERNQTLALSREVKRKDSALKQLEKQLQEIESEHANWMQRHQNASEAQIRQQNMIAQKEKQYLRELLAIEEEIAEQHIQSVKALEVAAREEMELMDRNLENSTRLLQDNEEHLKEKMDISYNLMKHRELTALAETTSYEKIRKLRMRRSRDDWLLNISNVIQGKEQELLAKDAMLNEKWLKEDDAMRLERLKRENQSRSFIEEEKLNTLQGEVAIRMQRLYLNRQAKLLEIERARAMRIAKEETEAGLDSAMRSNLLLKKQELASAAEQAAQVFSKGVHEVESLVLKMMDEIKEESARLHEAERAYALRENKNVTSTRSSLMQSEWSQKVGSQLSDVVMSQNALQEKLMALRQASLVNELNERNVLPSSEPLKGMTISPPLSTSDELQRVRKDVERLGNQVLNVQRDRLSTLQNSHGTTNESQTNQSSHRMDQQNPVNLQWNRTMSSIPSPAVGAGIGYGLYPVFGKDGKMMVQLDDDEEEVLSHPIEDVMKRASKAMLDHEYLGPKDLPSPSALSGPSLTSSSGSIPNQSNLIPLTGLSSSQLPKSFSLQSQRFQTTATTSAFNHGSKLNLNQNVVDFKSIGPSDQLDYYTEDYVQKQNNPLKSSMIQKLERVSSAMHSVQDVSKLSTEDLKLIANETLKNLRSTRILNRLDESDEVLGMAVTKNYGRNDFNESRAMSKNSKPDIDLDIIQSYGFDIEDDNSI